MLTRRHFLITTAAAATVANLPSASAQERDWSGKTPVRYPDADLVTLDKRFDKYKIGNTPILRLHTGMLWAEGPAWNGVGNYLVWSDIPNDIQLRWLHDDGHVSVMRRPAGYSNGNTFDWEGRQIAFEHGNRRVVRDGDDFALLTFGSRAPGDPIVQMPDFGNLILDPTFDATSLTLRTRRP